MNLMKPHILEGACEPYETTHIRGGHVNLMKPHILGGGGHVNLMKPHILEGGM